MKKAGEEMEMAVVGNDIRKFSSFSDLIKQPMAAHFLPWLTLWYRISACVGLVSGFISGKARLGKLDSFTYDSMFISLYAYLLGMYMCENIHYTYASVAYIWYGHTKIAPKPTLKHIHKCTCALSHTHTHKRKKMRTDTQTHERIAVKDMNRHTNKQLYG